MSVSAADFGFVSTLVRARSAIVLDAGKEYLVESRLLPVARQAGLTSVGDLVARLRAAPTAPLAGQVVEAMTTNETSWFRDSHPFTLLTETLLPELDRARGRERRLRVWSAASSTGQEAYSIAMVLADWTASHPGWQVEILGTDLSEEVLRQARSGTYSRLEVERGLSPGLRQRHLTAVETPAGPGWQVSPRLRSIVTFRALNLAGPFPPLGPFDIVFCRNVLIYFDTATRAQVLTRIGRTMRPDGALLLGAAETLLHVTADLERVQVGPASYHRLTGGRTKK